MGTNQHGESGIDLTACQTNEPTSQDTYTLLRGQRASIAWHQTQIPKAKCEDEMMKAEARFVTTSLANNKSQAAMATTSTIHWRPAATEASSMTAPVAGSSQGKPRLGDHLASLCIPLHITPPFDEKGARAHVASKVLRRLILSSRSRRNARSTRSARMPRRSVEPAEACRHRRTSRIRFLHHGLLFSSPCHKSPLPQL